MINLRRNTNPATAKQPAHPKRRLLRSATARGMAVTLAATGLVMAPAQPALASCSASAHPHAYRDNGYGSVTTDSVRIPVASHLQCSIRTYTSRNEVLLYHCWAIGDGVFGRYTWTYVQKAVAGYVQGWVSDYYSTMVGHWPLVRSGYRGHWFAGSTATSGRRA